MHVVAASAKSGATRSGAAGGNGILAPLLFTDPSDLPPPPVAALIGLSVRKRFGRMGTFVGTIASHDCQAGYRVEYTDGDAEDLSLEDILHLPLASPRALLGRRVSKHFAGFGRFEGEVAAYDPTDGFELHYEDGDSEKVGAAELVRLLLPPLSAKELKQRKRKRSAAAELRAGATQ